MHRPPRSRSASIFKRPVVGAALTIVPVLELGKLLVRRSSARERRGDP
jgi:hypothetical protein